MDSQIPSIILHQINHATLSKYVVPGSTPVPFFGNFVGASTYTIGINPSVREFYSEKGELLKHDQKRLEDYESLRLSRDEVIHSFSDKEVEKIYHACLKYFGPNYYHWFDRLESVVNLAFHSSYFDGSACHLDLIQWATDPIWGAILKADPINARYLLKNELPFLHQQIEWITKSNPNLERFVLSGKTVIESLKDIFSVKFVGRTDVKGKSKQYSYYVGHLGDTPVYGTSMNIPDSHTSNAHRESFKSWLIERGWKVS